MPESDNSAQSHTKAALEAIAAEVGIERVEVLHGHTTQDTAHVQDNYPYGRLRCFRRVWLEHTKNGYRLVTQTSNPKRDQDWNNAPKKSTYQEWAVMVRLPEKEDRPDDYIVWYGFGINGPGPAEDVRFRVSGIYDQLSDEERKWYNVFLKMNKRYAKPWEEWESLITDMVTHYVEFNGFFPEPDEYSRVLGRYVADRDWPAAKAAVLMKMHERDYS